MARPDKAATVAEITRRFNEADAALLTEYRGLTVGELADVRTSLRESGTELKVLKNTLARIAARETGMEDLVELLVGPTAIAFVSGDAAAAAKVLEEATRKYPVLVLKGGVLNGKVFDADQARSLARLEPREVLLARTAMLFNTPAQQTVNVLAALLRNFGSMLAQVVAKKEAGEVPAGDANGGSVPSADSATGQVAPEGDQAGPEAAEAAPDAGQDASATTAELVDAATGQTAEGAAVLPEAEDQAGAAPDATPPEQEESEES